jgi:zinc transport system permease protein
MIIGKQMTFFSDAIGHAGLTGIAIGVLLGMGNPMWAMIAFSVLLAGAVVTVRRYSGASTDTIIGTVMSFTVALGIVILSRHGGFTKYTRYLIGDILSVTPSDLAALLALSALFLLIWSLFYNRILLVSINAPLARSRRTSILGVELLFACLTAVIVSMTIQWIGILVINAMLVLPAAAARTVTRSNASYVWTTMGISLVCGTTGLIASFYWASATGATIVLFAMGFFVMSLGFKITR